MRHICILKTINKKQQLSIDLKTPQTHVAIFYRVLPITISMIKEGVPTRKLQNQAVMGCTVEVITSTILRSLSILV